MPKPYLPKIKVKTVFSTAQKMGATSSGKQISQTAFKKFLRQDKNLKGFSYKTPSATISKQKAQKFFGQVAGKIAQQKDLKLSYFAKKNMGVKVDQKGNISETTANKVYQTAAGEELKEMEPKGPSPEEIAKQERRKEAFKTLRKRETADEVRKEQSAGEKSVTQNKSTAGRPVQIQGGAGAGTMAKPQAPSDLSDVPSVQKKVGSTKSTVANVAILPLSNLSQNKSLGLVAQKLTLALYHIIGSYKKINLLEKIQVEKTMTADYGTQNVINFNTAREIQKKLDVDLLVTGDLKKIDNQTQVQIRILKSGEGQQIKIVDVKKETEDVFELEKHVGWYISNYFELLPKKISGTEPEEIIKKEDVEIPPPSKVEEMPI